MGRKGRTMVLVDIRETPSAKAADIFLQIRPGKDLRWSPRCARFLRTSAWTRRRVAEIGLTVEQLQDLVDQMKRARFGVLFFGMGLSMTRGKHMNSAAVLTLVRGVERLYEIRAMPMRGHGNVTGSDMVMRWTTGYPFGVNMCRGYPRLQPRRVFDGGPAGSRGQRCRAHPGRRSRGDHAPAGHRPPETHSDQSSGPKVTHTSRLARVHITTAVTGISAPGTVYRMDEVPLPLRPALHSPYPTDQEVIRRIRQAVAAKPAWLPARTESCQ